MANNAWVNSYLKAILEVGNDLTAPSGGKPPSAADGKSLGDAPSKDSLMIRERGHFSPAQYFVNEVIGFSESDLHRSWVLAAATRNSQERNIRLENLSWRIWHNARTKNKIKFEEEKYQRLRRQEMKKSVKETVKVLHEDPPDTEKDDDIVSLSGKLDGNFEDDSVHSVKDTPMRSPDVIGDKLYVVLISIHGLIRGTNMELGRDADSGGQVKYVVELAKALGSSPGVYRVDLLTRQIFDPNVDKSYSVEAEPLIPSSIDTQFNKLGPSSGAWITRIPFGPKNKYVPKEELWFYIQEFVDNAICYIKELSVTLGNEVNQGNPLWPVAIHGHYADAGDSVSLISGALNLPMIFTGHSLGRDKLAQLINSGRKRDDIDRQYKILRRIEAEELAIDTSEIVITSTRQEIEEQWNSYDAFNVEIANNIEREYKRGPGSHGRFVPRMVIIPPGMEFDQVVIDDDDMGEEENKHVPKIWKEIMRFLENPGKPIILAIARADPKKNIPVLVKAFGESDQLRELANLVLVMGNRTDIGLLSPASDSYMTTILRLIDKYDLYGQVAYPKQHRQSDVSDIYHLARKTKGVFINPALVEPFGLTLIEAAAHGVPVVATKNGGPIDIIRELEHGVLVDPKDDKEIADALYSILSNSQKWKNFHDNALKNKHKFSWQGHCKKYISEITNLQPRKRKRHGREVIEERFKNSLLSRQVQDQKDKIQNESSDENEGSSIDDPNLESVVFTTLSQAMSELGSKPCNISILKREFILVVAVDSAVKEDYIAIIKSALEASHIEKKVDSIGIVISTFLTISELHSSLTSGNIKPSDFDGFICNSGSDIYYPLLNFSDKTSSEFVYIRDDNYNAQFSYHWGGKWLTKALLSWTPQSAEGPGSAETEEKVVMEDEESSSSYCVALKVVNQQKLPPTRELRKAMRRQALRCHVVYSHDGRRINVIPVLASRAQAMRYLYTQWEIELSKITVLVGESGDSDHEGLLGGAHMAIVLKGAFNNAPSEKSVARTYSLDEFVARNPSSVVKIEGYSSSDIKQALQQRFSVC